MRLLSYYYEFSMLTFFLIGSWKYVCFSLIPMLFIDTLENNIRGTRNPKCCLHRICVFISTIHTHIPGTYIYRYRYGKDVRSPDLSLEPSTTTAFNG